MELFFLLRISSYAYVFRLVNRGYNFFPIMCSGSQRVFSGSGISLKVVWGSGFDCSQEVGFTKIVYGVWDSDMKQSGMPRCPTHKF